MRAGLLLLFCATVLVAGDPPPPAWATTVSGRSAELQLDGAVLRWNWVVGPNGVGFWLSEPADSRLIASLLPGGEARSEVDLASAELATRRLAARVPGLHPLLPPAALARLAAAGGPPAWSSTRQGPPERTGQELEDWLMLPAEVRRELEATTGTLQLGIGRPWSDAERTRVNDAAMARDETHHLDVQDGLPAVTGAGLDAGVRLALRWVAPAPARRAPSPVGLPGGWGIAAAVGIAGEAHWLGFSPDGRVLAVGAGDGGTTLWDVATGRALRSLDLLGRAAAWSPDSTTLYAYGMDGLRSAADAASGQRLWAVLPDAVAAMAIANDGLLFDRLSVVGDELVLGSNRFDLVVNRRDGQTAASADQRVLGPEGAWLADATGGIAAALAQGGLLLPQGGGLVRWTASGGLELLRLPDLAVVGRCPVPARGRTYRLIATGEPGIVLALDDQPLRCDLRSGSVVTGPTGSWAANGWRLIPALRCAVLRDADQIALLRPLLPGWSLLSRAQLGLRVWHDETPVAATPDGRWLAVVAADRRIRLHDPRDGTVVRAFGIPAAPVRSAAIAAAGRLAVLLHDLPEGQALSGLDLATWQVRWRTMPPAERRLTRLVAAPGGALALTDDDAALAVSEAGVCSPATLPAPSASPAPELRDGVLWQDGRALGLAPDAIAALVPLPDGDLVATGNGLSRWSPRAGLLAAEAVPTVQALPTADGARLLCVHADGTLALRAANDLAVLVAWAADAEGGAVAWLPDGRYAAPRQSTGAIAFVRGLELVEVEQFDLALNRPDQVLLAGGLADGRSIAALRQAHERRVARLGRQPSGPDSIERLPQLSFADGGPPATTAADSLTLRLAAQGRGAGLRALRVEVDGVPLHGRDGLPLAGAPARWEDAITVPLRPGPNRLRVAVEDAEGRESLRRVAVVVCTAAPRPATTHLIAFGVGAYADERWRLQYAAKDARDLAGRLGAAPGARINATVLTDASATRAALRAARSALAATAVQDRAILFVAGHGVLDARYDYWFAPADMDFAAPEARGIPFAELEELLDGIPARDRLLLIDTCHSGELDRDGLGAAPARPVGGGAVTARGFRRLAGSGPPAIDFLDLRRGVGASVLTSSSGAEFAFESDAWRNGVFTYALLAGLAGAADGDGDGQVRVSELHRHVVSEVVRLTGGEQRPTARVENLGNDFAVARTR